MGPEKDYHLYVKMHDLHFNDNTVTKARFKMLCCAVIMSNFRSSNRKSFEWLLVSLIIWLSKILESNCPLQNLVFRRPGN